MPKVTTAWQSCVQRRHLRILSASQHHPPAPLPVQMSATARCRLGPPVLAARKRAARHRDSRLTEAEGSRQHTGFTGCLSNWASTTVRTPGRLGSGRMAPGQGCWHSCHWTLQAKGTWTGNPGEHCLPADPATLHSPLEIQSQAWRLSLARPESGPSSWLPRGREGALPTPGSVAGGRPCLSPATSSTPSSQDAVWGGGSGNRK